MDKNKYNLRKDIEHAINCASAENASGTPDFILAEYLMDCLEVYDRTVQKRELWYGREIHNYNDSKEISCDADKME